MEGKREPMLDRIFIVLETYGFPIFAVIVTIVGIGQALVPRSWKFAVYAFLGL